MIKYAERVKAINNNNERSSLDDAYTKVTLL